MPERKTRVLLVEDSVGLRDTLADVLRAAGMEVDTASDASAASGRLTHGRYDVAIVDLVLPGRSGVQVIRELKSVSPATHVFVCTAYPEGELVTEAWALGIEVAISKPADPGLLIGLIEKSVGPAQEGNPKP